MPRQLPEDLLRGPFLARDAVASGVSAKRLRGRDLDASIWGVRHSARAETIRERCEMYTARMPPGAFFSHSTAALLLGIPVPWRLEQASDVHIAVRAPARAPHAAGIRGHSLTLAPEHLQTLDGVTLTAPARTWCDLASQVDLLDLVAAGDFLLHWRAPLVTREELFAVASTFPGRRGATRMRAAAPFLNDRAESPPESHLRVILVRGGLPEPEVNPSLALDDDGSVVRLDLAYPKYRVLLEYQGDYHRSKSQWRKDLTRRSRLEAEGWIVIELGADDLRDPEELVARVRTVLTSRGWRN